MTTDARTMSARGPSDFCARRARYGRPGTSQRRRPRGPYGRVFAVHDRTYGGPRQHATRSPGTVRRDAGPVVPGGGTRRADSRDRVVARPSQLAGRRERARPKAVCEPFRPLTGSDRYISESFDRPHISRQCRWAQGHMSGLSRRRACRGPAAGGWSAIPASVQSAAGALHVRRMLGTLGACRPRSRRRCAPDRGFRAPGDLGEPPPP